LSILKPLIQRDLWQSHHIEAYLLHIEDWQHHFCCAWHRGFNKKTIDRPVGLG
jgi:predicted acetyltransferase